MKANITLKLFANNTTKANDIAQIVSNGVRFIIICISWYP